MRAALLWRLKLSAYSMRLIAASLHFPGPYPALFVPFPPCGQYLLVLGSTGRAVISLVGELAGLAWVLGCKRPGAWRYGFNFAARCMNYRTVTERFWRPLGQSVRPQLC